MALNYTRDESVGNKLTPGNYRVVVVSAEEATSKSSGKEMIVIGVRPSGAKMTIKQYIVEGEYFNSNLTKFFDSFDVEDGNMNLMSWIGAMGAAKLKEDGDYLKVDYFIRRDKAKDLPEFEGDKPERQTVSHMEELDDGQDLPF